MNRTIRLGLVGNPENRRLRDFAARWQALGQATPTLIDYQHLPTHAPKVDVLRIDSPGENTALASQLIALGGGPANVQLEHGEIGYLREFHQGYCELLRQIEAWQLPCFNGPSEIAVMFDKWQCHQRFAAQGLARPNSVMAPSSYAQWHQARPEQGRIFLKPLHGSSSSGVCALRWTPTRQQLIGPISISGGRLYNSLRVRRYQSWAEIDYILTRLLPQGMISETWIPKLSIAGGVVDARIVVIAGQARHTVLRQSQSPMTNLHLGNRRADPTQLAPELSAAARLAVQAASCFPGSLYAGVDVLLDGHGRPYIGEINAFGDLLPGLSDRGEDTYSAIAQAYLARRSLHDFDIESRRC